MSGAGMMMIVPQNGVEIVLHFPSSSALIQSCSQLFLALVEIAGEIIWMQNNFLVVAAVT